jgi:regulator of protease activity HflC (stomatin/prohibitin superfamily)
MIRSSIVATAIVSLLLATACDKASDDQHNANAAQAVANDKIAAAGAEATQKVSAAQAEANQKVAEAQANFMKLREDYRHSTTTSLVDMDKKIGDLDIKASTATGKGRSDLETNLKQIHAARQSFGADYQTLETASATTWDAARARLDKEWADLRALVDKA